ncbi:chemotaxis protein CheW [Pleurocapsa sp. PCC 7319]|uniref:chemotaxis protein CheW n=1 Tax=Pleurocapsa sp. PCC 7319 TaxID=118161 RepID=UPI0003497EF0|nr:chemotaxis protein CheW [Pleurocapsa sp. PCC 7319]
MFNHSSLRSLLAVGGAQSRSLDGVQSPLVVGGAQSRRSARRKNKAEQPIIAFQLGREWFALPILAIQKVIPVSQINYITGDSQNNLYQFKDKKLTIIDVEQHIFANSSPSKSSVTTDSSLLKQPELTSPVSFSYVAILQQEAEILAGLPLNSQPVIYKVPPTDFQAITSTEIGSYDRQYIESKVTNIDEISRLFILNLQQLLQLIN